MAKRKRRTKQAPSGPGALAAAISSKGIQKGAAAELVGFHAPQLSYYLHGHRTPSLAHAAALEDAFGVPMRSWLEGWRP